MQTFSFLFNLTIRGNESCFYSTYFALDAEITSSTSNCSMNHSVELSLSEEFDGSTAVACVILGLSFLVGAPGNVLVIWTILRHVKQHSHTVVIILHLAVADLLVLITLPLWIYSLVHTWVFGAVLCKTLVYTVTVCMFSSIFLITVMSVERFLAICHPFLMMRWKTKSNIKIYLVLLWLLAFLLGVPALTQNLENTDGNVQCFTRELNSDTNTIIILCLETLLVFIVPFIVLSICYCLVAAQIKKMSFNSKEKSMVLIHSVVIAFTVCWLPYHVINIIDLICILSWPDTDDDCVSKPIIFIVGALVFISSSVNPVLYAFFAKNLQGSLEESRLVRLFKEIATNTNKVRELAVQQQTDQRAASTQEELLSDCVCQRL